MSTTEISRYIKLLGTITESQVFSDHSDLGQLQNQRDQLLSSLNIDTASVAAVLEVHDAGDEELAATWFDVCLNIYRNIIKRGHAPVYRHMMVYDFAEFIEGLYDGSRTVGEYWSYNPDIESPTWKENQRGSVPVLMQGKVDLSQIDWEATLHQNFEWPHEGELIFKGSVFVEWIQDRDTDEYVNFDKRLPR